jgi:hypothetical protein
MKKVATTLLIAAFIVWAIVDEIREFRANDTAEYYSSHPQRLLYVLGITILGAVVAVVFYRLSPQAQRRARLFALGGVAFFLTTFLGYMLFQLLPLSSLLASPVGVALLCLPLLFVGALASGFWYEFFHVLKRGQTRFL